MSEFRTRLDPWIIVLAGLIAVWWVFAGSDKTPASSIDMLARSTDPKLWIEALESGDRTIRDYARENILKSLTPDALGPVAMEECKSSDASGQLAGLWVLGRVSVAGRGQLAATFLQNDNPSVLAAALRVLAEDPMPSVRDRILAFVDDPEVEVKAASLSALAALHDPNDLPLLISNLSETSASVREAARNGILNIAPYAPQTVAALITAAYGSDRSAGREALQLLGDVGDPAALDALFAFVERGPVGMTGEAADAIGKIGGKRATDHALELYRNGEGQARNQAARILGAIGVVEARDYLWAVVRDDSNEFWLRYWSMDALATCGDASLVPDVIDFLDKDEPDPRLIRVGIEALGGMDGDQVIGLYDRIIAGDIDFGLNESGGHAALVSVITGLGKMNTDASRERLRSLATSTEPDSFDVVRAIAMSLGKVGTPQDIEILRDLERDRFILDRDISAAIAQIEQRYPSETDDPH